MVTDADLAIQEHLATAIARAFPDDPVVGEEGLDGRRPKRRPVCLDHRPVDGTNNFGAGLPGFAVSIGVLRTAAVRGRRLRSAHAPALHRVRRPGRVAQRLAAAHARRTPLPQLAGLDPHAVDGGLAPFVEEWLRRYRLRRFGSTALQLCLRGPGRARPRARPPGLDLGHRRRGSRCCSRPVESSRRRRLVARSRRRPRRWRDAPIAFLAGNPASHAQGIADIAAASAFARPLVRPPYPPVTPPTIPSNTIFVVL